MLAYLIITFSHNRFLAINLANYTKSMISDWIPRLSWSRIDIELSMLSIVIIMLYTHPLRQHTRIRWDQCHRYQVEINKTKPLISTWTIVLSAGEHVPAGLNIIPCFCASASTADAGSALSKSNYAHTPNIIKPSCGSNHITKRQTTTLDCSSKQHKNNYKMCAI